MKELEIYGTTELSRMEIDELNGGGFLGTFIAVSILAGVGLAIQRKQRKDRADQRPGGGGSSSDYLVGLY
ncbi:hypothetical protein [Ulvibacterium sp.]|uniref:hypothetical protein n=1 Tax=Ulvibacterium sp. TaxID=2665914 RepID=UPI00263499F7|nr:hypothetical protein [Ulvibacterium sp.]